MFTRNCLQMLGALTAWESDGAFLLMLISIRDAQSKPTVGCSWGLWYAVAGGDSKMFVSLSKICETWPFQGQTDLCFIVLSVLLVVHFACSCSHGCSPSRLITAGMTPGISPLKENAHRGAFEKWERWGFWSWYFWKLYWTSLLVLDQPTIRLQHWTVP